MIENWKISKIYRTRTMFECPFHKSQKGGADLDLTIEGEYSGKFYCYGCKKSGSVPMSDVMKLREMRGEYKEQQVVKDWGKLNQYYINNRFTCGIQSPLQLSKTTMMKLEHGWDNQAHTFPERDSLGNVIGILRRFPDGNKGVVAGSCRGLTVPRIQFDPNKTLYITEGCSDLGVILECGCQGIARPNSNSCNDLAVEWASKFTNAIRIIADNDKAGINGAIELQVNEFKNDLRVEVLFPEASDLYDTFLELGLEETKAWVLQE